MADWIHTSVQLPPDGVVVETKIDDKDGCRNEQPLLRQGRLWFFPDQSMYVYYTPTHWRPSVGVVEELEVEIEGLSL